MPDSLSKYRQRRNPRRVGHGQAAEPGPEWVRSGKTIEQLAARGGRSA